ncbi:hypothetical protein [Halobacillus halophilus]|uniref:hypothetical protein n=1 Tax=Halobacillus halophilus TaxID=1570 RepID=UPI001314433C|nr:hypothetical protein [Halobacillus halophilus]
MSHFYYKSKHRTIIVSYDKNDRKESSSTETYNRTKHVAIALTIIYNLFKFSIGL